MTIAEFSRAGLSFDVRDEGPVAGEPIVLLHGFPERSSCWREVTPLLHEAGFRTIAPDQRGYSARARPRRRRDYRMAELAADVAELIDTIGQPVHLVGHDWGAAVGWAVASRRPELLRSWTAFSVPHPVPYARALLGPQGPKSWYMALFNLPLLPEQLARPGGFLESMLRRSGMGEPEIQRFRTEIVSYGALPGALGWYRAMPFALLDPVGKIAVPTTLVWSDGDTAIDRAGAAATERYCTGPYEYVELAGVSHWIPTSAPRLAADAILSRIAD